ncbi:MAG TPA: biotin--[acetyl-CoA-carboxylase] ligase [Beijerinckiaceae bacterium]|mgnify:CR=1 FL=1|nr:biotin--[acetyl-CoA-carboxylase] ligase [Beijerinckiaceae bacterium]
MRLGGAATTAGYSLVSLQSVDSTNRLALDLAQQAGADRTWVVSEEQRAGRGRQGRTWASPPGNFYGSLLLVAPCPTRDLPKLGFVAGVALADTVRSLSLRGPVHLKWPNDLMAGNAKLAGMLLEGRAMADGRMAIAIGIGLNIANAPPVSGRQTTSLGELGVHADRREVFRGLSDRVAERLDQFAGGTGFALIRDAWTERTLPLGTAISVQLASGLRGGRFAGIDASGQLLLDTAAGRIAVEAGDVLLNASESAFDHG